MLAIRMQRTGRKGHAMFRMVVQDSRRTPTSGKVVALLGNYDPHAKTVSFDKEKAAFYLEHGAQPSERVTRLLKSEGVKLPKWVALEDKKTGKLRNPEKLRRNRPAEAAAPEASEAPTEPETAEAAAKPTEPTESKSKPAEPAESPAEESAPAEEPSADTESTPAEADSKTEEKPEAAEPATEAEDSKESA